MAQIMTSFIHPLAATQLLRQLNSPEQHAQNTSHSSIIGFRSHKKNPHKPISQSWWPKNPKPHSRNMNTKFPPQREDNREEKTIFSVPTLHGCSERFIATLQMVLCEKHGGWPWPPPVRSGWRAMLQSPYMDGQTTWTLVTLMVL